MSSERPTDDEIANRIAAYAALGAQLADAELGPSEVRPSGPPFWTAGLVILLTIGAGLALSATLYYSGVGVRPTATPSPTLPTSSAPSPSVPTSSVAASEVITPSPGSVAIVGETPGPEASAPASVPLVSGVDLSDVALLAGRLGLSCVSGQTDPHMVGYPWVVRCEGLSADGRIEITVLVEYWAVDAVQRIGLSLYPANDADDVTDATTARQEAAGAVAGVSFEGATPTAFRTWLFDRLAAVKDCKDGCSVDAGTAQLRIVHGSRGAVDLYLEPATT